MVWQLIGMANASANIYNAYTGKRIADHYVGGGNNPRPQAPEHPAIRHLLMVGELCQVGLLTQEQADALAEKIRPHLPFRTPYYGPAQHPAPSPSQPQARPQDATEKGAAVPNESEQRP